MNENLVSKPACLSSQKSPQSSQKCEKLANPNLESVVGYGQTPLILKGDPCPAVGHKKGVEDLRLR